MANRIELPFQYIPNFDRGRPLFGGDMYIGNPNTDPKIPANQKQVSIQEAFVNGLTPRPISQPIELSNGGVPQYAGNPVVLTVEGNYSIRVDDANGNQVYYFPSVSIDGVITESSIGGYTNLTFSTLANLIAGTTTGGNSAGTISNNEVAFLSEGGRAGKFVFNSSNLITQVAADTRQGVYVAPSTDTTGASGAWVRVLDGFLTPEMFGAVGDGVANDGPAIRACCLYATNNDIPEVRATKSVYLADSIILYRNVVIVGSLESETTFRQSAGAFARFVESENFSTLTGSADSVASNPQVPSWFGLKRILVDGNKAANNTSVGVSIYGAAPVFESVVILNCGGNGFYSEYTTVTGSTNIQQQEEGYIRDLICRDNNGDGWICRGPHNVYIGNYIGCFNGGYGFWNQTSSGVYLGAPTYIDVLHCYANDVNYTPVSGTPRRNIRIGANVSCGAMIVDGGQCVVEASDCLFSIVKQFLGGQGDSDGMIISGSENQIGIYSGIMRNDPEATGLVTGAASLRITGNFNKVGTCRIRGTAQYNQSGQIERGFNGLVITGTANGVADLYTRECNIGLSVSGPRNRIDGNVVFCATGFDYTTTTGGNEIGLHIFSSPSFGGVNYVSGDRPVVADDTFKIKAEGLAVGFRRTSHFFEMANIDNTIQNQTITIPHTLLYTPRRQDCTLQMTGLAGVGPEIGYARISATDATNATIELEFTTVGTGTSSWSLASTVY